MGRGPSAQAPSVPRRVCARGGETATYRLPSWRCRAASHSILYWCSQYANSHICYYFCHENGSFDVREMRSYERLWGGAGSSARVDEARERRHRVSLAADGGRGARGHRGESEPVRLEVAARAADGRIASRLDKLQPLLEKLAQVRVAQRCRADAAVEACFEQLLPLEALHLRRARKGSEGLRRAQKCSRARRSRPRGSRARPRTPCTARIESSCTSFSRCAPRAPRRKGPGCGPHTPISLQPALSAG